MIQTKTFSTKTEIITALHQQAEEISAFMNTLSLEAFLAPQHEHWSPSGHMRHLIKSMRAVTEGMNYPALLIRVLFGANSGTSRGYEEIVTTYRAALAAGGKSTKKYLPSADPSDMAGEEWRDITMNRWDQVHRDMIEALSPWSEERLDKYRLPHPLLGKLTLREMLFFTIYHNGHHADLVKGRL